jgi:RHS repeat-associated protein
VYEGREIVAIVDAAGARTSLSWARAGNLAEIVTPDGAKTSREHDALGRVVAVHDARGNVQRRTYDGLGRVVRVDEPDGNVRVLERDGEGNVVRAQDRLRDVRLSYGGMSWLVARRDGGLTVQYRYDTEGQLVGVVNERGLEHRFELDAVGRVRAEIAVDGLTTTIQRDAAGRPTQALGPDGKVTTFEHDAAGRRTKTAWADGASTTLEYDAMGRLVRAANFEAVVAFERDLLGRVVTETCTRGDTSHEDRRETVVERRWDHHGRRIGVRSSLGADATIERDAMGDVARVGARQDAQRWEASFVRDVLGAEIDRVLPGGARSYRWRDSLGRISQHWIGREQHSYRTRRYRWDVDDRLLAIEEEGRGELVYAHDSRGALVSAETADGRIEGRYPDEVGNLFASASRSDREYGAAGELRIARTPDGAVALEYDTRGRLSVKREPGGAAWRYHWNDADQLVQVDRPDGTAVAMAYDALGRRLSKNHLGRKTCFVWDGDVVLHEWSEAADVPQRRRSRAESAHADALVAAKAHLQRMFPDAWTPRWHALLANDEGFEQLHAELRERETAGEPKPADDAASPVLTWLFEPGSFAPLARLSASTAHSIVTDHVGTPLVVLDDRGSSRAQFIVDTYGRARTAGAAALCPFRFAGQYADPETGLHYNRFRHYDPATGEYISRDPIGLRGGLRAYAYVDDPTTWTDPLGLSKTAGAGESCSGTSESTDVGPETTALVRFDGEFAARQLLGREPVTPGGRKLMAHAADRMVNPPGGRAPMSMEEVDEVLDSGTRIRKVTSHADGDTITIQHEGLPGKPQVVVDAATGTRVITVVSPKGNR